MAKYIRQYTRDDVDSGWAFTQMQLSKNYYKREKKIKKVKKPAPVANKSMGRSLRKIANDIRLSVNNNTRGGKIESASDFLERQRFIQHQTPEQFELAKKHGWRVAQALTQPEPNFHEP